jgi:hypothetical protein
MKLNRVQARGFVIPEAERSEAEKGYPGSIP